jgi:hypothetical protein
MTSDGFKTMSKVLEETEAGLSEKFFRAPLYEIGSSMVLP